MTDLKQAKRAFRAATKKYLSIPYGPEKIAAYEKIRLASQAIVAARKNAGSVQS